MIFFITKLNIYIHKVPCSLGHLDWPRLGGEDGLSNLEPQVAPIAAWLQAYLGGESTQQNSSCLEMSEKILLYLQQQ